MSTQLPGIHYISAHFNTLFQYQQDLISTQD